MQCIAAQQVATLCELHLPILTTHCLMRNTERNVLDTQHFICYVLQAKHASNLPVIADVFPEMLALDRPCPR